MNQSQADAVNNDRFVRSLVESSRGVWTAARWLAKLGFAVTVNPTRVRPSHSQWKEYADEGDIHVAQRVEVKQLTAQFTSREDWPFGDKFIVCARHSFDRAPLKPLAYIILNATGSCAAVVKGETSKRWTVERRVDSRYEASEQEFYFAPLDCVRFHSLPVDA